MECELQSWSQYNALKSAGGGCDVAHHQTRRFLYLALPLILYIACLDSSTWLQYRRLSCLKVPFCGMLESCCSTGLEPATFCTTQTRSWWRSNQLTHELSQQTRQFVVHMNFFLCKTFLEIKTTSLKHISTLLVLDYLSCIDCSNIICIIHVSAWKDKWLSRLLYTSSKYLC